MPFRPNINDTIEIDGVPYHICEHPHAPNIPYGQEGRQGTVYQVRGPDGHRALKVFKARFRIPSLVTLTDRLKHLATIRGLDVCNRVVLTPRRHAALLRDHPDLTYGVLMPWISGVTWLDVVLNQQPLTPAQSLGLARVLADLLATMEERGLAHCDLSSPNIILPGLGQPGLATPVVLVDVEGMYSPGFDRPEAIASGSSGYAHRTMSAGQWGPTADRFAGALLIAELLGWCDPSVRAAASNESYFDTSDLQQPGPRYDTLRDSLLQRYGSKVAQMLDQVWQSDTLGDCPTFGEWLVALPERIKRDQFTPAAVPTYSELSKAQTLIQFAYTLSSQGNLEGALTAYRSAFDLLDAADPMRIEVASLIADLEEKQRSLRTPSSPEEDRGHPAHRPTWPWIITGGVIFLIVVLTMQLLGWPSAVDGLGEATDTATGNGSATAGVLPNGTTTGNAVPVPVTDTPAESSPEPSAPPITLDGVEPREVYVGSLPVTIRLRGEGLGAVTSGALVATARVPIPVELSSDQSSGTIELTILSLPEPITGSSEYTFRLNGQLVDGQTVELRDFVRTLQPQGLRPEYDYTNRIAVDASGPYTRLRIEPRTDSEPVGLLRPDDTVQLLGVYDDTWYRVRISSAADVAQVGVMGYIESWLMEDVGVPPPPTPTAQPQPTTRPQSVPKRLRFVKINEDDNPSCVSVGIRGIGTAGWSFRVDGMNLRAQFDGAGNARVCGLAQRQEVTISVFNAKGALIPGGSGVPVRGSAIMVAEWR